MIQRRTFILGFCGLFAAPTVTGGASQMPTNLKEDIFLDASTRSYTDTVAFAINGWDLGEKSEVDTIGQHVVTINLTASWQCGWL